MKPILASLAATLVAGLAATTAAPTAQAATYYRCTGGSEFRLNSANNGVHCYKPGAIQDAVINCPQLTLPGTNQKIGTFPVAKPGKDKCAGTTQLPGGGSNTTELDPLPCSSGFSYVQNAQGNTDRCRRQIAPTVTAPSQAFSSTP